ncbi:MAG TPA: KpsF/GutQ family sugar-phosphate isomerase [Candidatus Coprenecus merdigallinarum]|nr:KpsF/GutQ family sugar-phosphate isomerase [Candidatus Coprenecus merdigallinarum]
MENIIEKMKKYASETIVTEAKAVSVLSSIVDDSFGEAVAALASARGRIVVSGVGKSALIARKMVATLNSTGSRAVFLHSSDAVHGDMGMIGPDDVVLFISKSGNTEEIRRLLPFVRKMGNHVVSIVSCRESFLGTHSDSLIYVPVEREAGPDNLAPTTSTTLHLVVCDAIAMALSRFRNFTADDFARIHPGGSLGKRLYMRVEDVFDRTNRPWVSEDEAIKNVIITISSHRLGATVVLGPDGNPEGIITDGDVRRMVENGKDINTLRAKDIMSRHPKTIDVGALAAEALRKMEENKITSVVVLREGKYAGLIHIHDIMREGIQ